MERSTQVIGLYEKMRKLGLYLPENYRMMHISADRVDEWCNKMIRQCDLIVTEELAKLMQIPVITNPEEVKVGPGLHHAFIDKEQLSYFVGMAINQQ